MRAIAKTCLWAVLAAGLAATPAALAQDAGLRDAAADAARTDGGDAGDAGRAGDGGSTGPDALALCPGSTRHGSAPIAFERRGPVDFGPGTGASMVGDRSTVGMEYNLLFSGDYIARMRGQLNVDWPRALTFSTIGDPMGGFFDVTFGLRMTATLYVLGVPIAVPLTSIIDDNVDHGSATFDPWAWNYEGTNIHLNVSAWRTIYTYTLNVGGDDYPIDLMVRYNMNATLRTVEIGFPDPTSHDMNAPNLAQITGTMPQAYLPPPVNGNLDLLTRWKPQIHYEGLIEFRIRVRRRVCVGIGPLMTCTDVDFSAPEFQIVQTHDSLPDPYDQQPHYEFPAHTTDRPEIDFGDVHIGDTVNDGLAITNTGRALLAVAAPTPSERAFHVDPSVCLRPGANGTLGMSFTPPREGSFQTEIVLNTNSTRGPETVILRGNGVTGMTRPPVRADAGPEGGRVADGGDAGYRTLVGEASCACRAAGMPAGHGRNARGAALLAGLAALGVVARRRRR